jgi:hypothetical protein
VKDTRFAAVCDREKANELIRLKGMKVILEMLEGQGKGKIV